MVLKKGNTLQSNTPNNHIILELRNLRHLYHSLIHLFMLFHTGYWTWPVGSRLTGTKHAGEGENDTQTLTVDAIKNQSCAKRWAFVHHFYLSDVHVCAMCLCVCVCHHSPQEYPRVVWHATKENECGDVEVWHQTWIKEGGWVCGTLSFWATNQTSKTSCKNSVRTCFYVYIYSSTYASACSTHC